MKWKLYPETWVDRFQVSTWRILWKYSEVISVPDHPIPSPPSPILFLIFNSLLASPVFFLRFFVSSFFLVFDIVAFVNIALQGPLLNWTRLFAINLATSFPWPPGLYRHPGFYVVLNGTPRFISCFTSAFARLLLWASGLLSFRSLPPPHCLLD